jgi:hypothetical protein
MKDERWDIRVLNQRTGKEILLLVALSQTHSDTGWTLIAATCAYLLGLRLTQGAAKKTQVPASHEVRDIAQTKSPVPARRAAYPKRS